MRPPERAPSLTEAAALGLLQGPTELLPVSSSAHLSLVPWLAGRRYDPLEAPRRKSFEIVVHAGGGLALLLVLRGELRRGALELDRDGVSAWALALLPPALLGSLLRGPIERRLAGPRSIAAGLIAGAVAMVLADARPSAAARPLADFGRVDGLALGVAQALALVPGVSRSGATLAAARARGYGRAEAQALSWRAGLPVILGASALEGARLLRGELEGPQGPPALGGAAAFVSTFVLAGPRGARALRGRALAPYACYRCLLAALVLVRLRRAQ